MAPHQCPIRTELPWRNTLEHRFFIWNSIGTRLRGYLNNVLVINDAVFLYLGVDDVVSLHPSGHFTLATPIRFRDVPLASPELRKIHTLPASLSHTAVYYSLAALVCQSMFANVDPTTLHQDTECLQPIVETRLYWFLLRALVPDPEDRTCLFI